MDMSERRRRAQQEAAEWWVVFQGDVPRDQRAQYVDWLRESPIHIAEMLHMAQVHGTLDQFDRWAQQPTGASGGAEDVVIPLPESDVSVRTPTGPAKGIARGVKLAWPVAAVFVVFVALSVMVWRALGGQVIQTERGERREVALPDGSVVQVDPETRLRVNYEESVRQVVLESGRALFQVAKSPHRPFLVQSDNATILAVGTEFAVERRSQSVLVTVAEGKVAVLPLSSVTSEDERKRRTQATSRASGDAARKIMLTANQQVVISASGGAEPVRNIDSARALAWAEGQLIFTDEPVGKAAKQFNRYNRIQISIKDAELASRPISGVFNAADPESFVALIEAMASVRVTRAASADITIDSAK